MSAISQKFNRRHMLGNRNVITVVFLALFVYQAQAQDLHLSQIHASPTYINPGMNGLFQEDVRLIANYRGQWNSFTNGYRSFLASADMKMRRKFRGDDVALGIQLTGDKAGDLNFTTITGTFSASYLKALDEYGGHFLAFGASAGFVHRSLDVGKASFLHTTDALIHGDGFKPNLNYLDVSAGVAWFYPISRENEYAYLGVSMFHLNQAMISHDVRQFRTATNTMLHSKLVFHGGMSFKMNPYITLKPSFIFMDQGPHREVSVGTYVQMNRRGKAYYSDANSLYVGAWYRFSPNSSGFQQDALVASVRYDYANHIFALSYDLNTSPLANASNYQGGPELSYIHYIDMASKKRRFKVKCPKF